MAHQRRVTDKVILYNYARNSTNLRVIIRRRGLPEHLNPDGKPFAPDMKDKIYGLIQAISEFLHKYSAVEEVAIVKFLVERESTNKKSRNSDELSSSTIEKSDSEELTKYLISLRQLMTPIVYFLNVRIVSQYKLIPFIKMSFEKVDPKDVPKVEEFTEGLIQRLKLAHLLRPTTSAIDDKKDLDNGSLQYYWFEFMRDLYYDLFDEYFSVATKSELENILDHLAEYGKKLNENSEPDLDNVEEKMKNC